VEGFTFDDCLPLTRGDAVQFPLRWKSGKLQEVLGRIVRLEMEMRHARLFAIRGKMHFIDAQDKWMIEDAKSITT